eukprot:TRINITY_DN34193_c0_g1_i1.p1 TRINITY_DN34193_c0_g1~~TRINITY_DN34193_c0_g1_i1.p1  ORF type:complete len:602 (+),score=105.47 TRINITY_DN34193_c0_g1_i1:55-1860(+)
MALPPSPYALQQSQQRQSLDGQQWPFQQQPSEVSQPQQLPYTGQLAQQTAYACGSGGHGAEALQAGSCHALATEQQVNLAPPPLQPPLAVQPRELGMTPGRDALPEPSALQESRCWTVVRGPASNPTAPMGDWRVWPHLGNVETFKATVGSNVQVLESFLNSKGIYVESCVACTLLGRGRLKALSEHVNGRPHFKDLCVILEDGKDVATAREKLWQTWNFAGGTIRFNHADGVIEMWKGPPPSAPQQNLSLQMPLMSQHQMLPVQAPQACSGLPSELRLDLCEQEDHWYTQCQHVGLPTETDGDRDKIPWLGSRSAWRTGFQDRAELVEKFLNKLNIFHLDCSICTHGGCWSEHVPADKHRKSLYERLPAGVPVKRVVQDFWQTWAVPGGAIRFNHLMGRVQLGRGRSNPNTWRVASAAASALPSPAPAQPLPAPSASSAPSSSFQGPGTQEPATGPPAFPGGYAGMRPMASGGGPQPPSADAVQTHNFLYWLWTSKFSDEAEAVEQELKERGIPDHLISCNVCGVSMAGKVSEHLLSRQHLENLMREAWKAAREGNSPSTPASVYQEWKLPASERLVLNHLFMEFKVLPEFLQLPPGPTL